MNKKHSTHICVECQSQFTIPYKIDGSPRKLVRATCSSKCKERARASTRPPRNRDYQPIVVSSLCAYCHKEFSYQTKGRHVRKACSNDCANANREMIRNEIASLRRIARRIASAKSACRQCQTFFLRSKMMQPFCSDECLAMDNERKALERKSAKLKAAALRRANRPRRRARHYGVEYEPIDPIKVLMRDGWRCHLCGVTTPANLRGTHEDNAPEVDHIIPMSKGGGHTWGNVACSCRRCNIRKSNNPLGQIGLGFSV